MSELVTYESEYRLIEQRVIAQLKDRLNDYVEYERGRARNANEVDAVIMYNAERKFWEREMGETDPFPGKLRKQPISAHRPHSPPPSSITAPATVDSLIPKKDPGPIPDITPGGADWMRLYLERFIADPHHDSIFPKDYRPRFGWNPATGEPWLAMRLKARYALEALTGIRDERLKKLLSMLPGESIKLQYAWIDVQPSGYVLVWPEFGQKSSIHDSSAWTELNKFRRFLQEWDQSLSRNLIGIDSAYAEYRKDPANDWKGLLLPDDFPQRFRFPSNPPRQNHKRQKVKSSNSTPEKEDSKTNV